MTIRTGYWECSRCAQQHGVGSAHCQHGGTPRLTAKKRSNGFKFFAAVMSAASVLFAGAIFLLLRATALPVWVEQVHWEKTLEILRLEVQRKQAWLDEVPADAVEIARSAEKRDKQVQDGTIKVKIGQKSLEDGTFQDVFEERPRFVTQRVDDTWVTYEAARWVEERTLKKETNDGREPEDLSFALTSPKQRFGDRTNEVKIALRASNGRQYTYTFDLEGDASQRSRVDALRVGQRYTAMVNGIGVVTQLQ